jgi:hypothetical protein
VRFNEGSRRFGYRDDMGREAVAPAIRRQRPFAWVHRFVVAMVVIDPDLDFAGRGQRLGDHVRSQQMAVNNIVAAGKHEPGQPGKITRKPVMKRKRPHGRPRLPQALPKNAAPVHDLRASQIEAVDDVKDAVAAFFHFEALSLTAGEAGEFNSRLAGASHS